jgi:hypothetical protein
VINEAQKDEDRELENDLAERVEKQTSGELIDDEPIIPDDPVEEIEVRTPKLLTKQQANERRAGEAKRRDDVKVTAGKKAEETNPKKRPL